MEACLAVKTRGRNLFPAATASGSLSATSPSWSRRNDAYESKPALLDRPDL